MSFFLSPSTVFLETQNQITLNELLLRGSPQGFEVSANFLEDRIQENQILISTFSSNKLPVPEPIIEQGSRIETNRAIGSGTATFKTIFFDVTTNAAEINAAISHNTGIDNSIRNLQILISRDNDFLSQIRIKQGVTLAEPSSLIDMIIQEQPVDTPILDMILQDEIKTPIQSQDNTLRNALILGGALLLVL